MSDIKRIYTMKKIEMSIGKTSKSQEKVRNFLVESLADTSTIQNGTIKGPDQKTDFTKV